ncbi:hypothetical protein EZ428_18645 [Pedobacter frigiditerrae]|uniref:Uncharacterized protein n=2 Tax=Pedobacter frigiditerrae TaxID=2530452 RepID=A0A4R0MQ28_9SPHI|nr:hypothetical protein EZ428_18645 [Pedobacter frigiditerrae]
MKNILKRIQINKMEILTSLLQFWDSEHTGIISKIVASASYDTLKKHVDFKPLFIKIGKMFSTPEKAETFVKEICERQGTGSLGQDINKLYTEVSGDQAPSDLFPILSDWAKENLQNIKNINNFSASKTSGFVIGSQTAGRDINMIQGNYYANPENNED